MILSQQFIKIDNKLFDILSTQEMYVYCYLKYRYIYQARYTETSIDILAENMSFVKDKSTNRKRIRDALLKLQQQGAININYKNKMKNNSALRINIPDTDKQQFTKLDYKYMSVEDHQELYVIAIISRWQNAKEKTFSQTEWAKMLGVARSTMQDIFKRMEEKKLILVKTGDFYMAENGQILRQENEYCLVGDSSVEKIDVEIEPEVESAKTKNTKKSKPAKTKKNSSVWVNENGLINGKYTDKRLLERDNLIRNGADLNDYDFEIYLTTNDMELKKRAEYRFYQQIGVNAGGLKFVQDSLRRVERMLAEKETRNKRLDVMSTLPPPDKQLEYMIEDTAKEVDG